MNFIVKCFKARTENIDKFWQKAPDLSRYAPPIILWIVAPLHSTECRVSEKKLIEAYKNIPA